MHGGHLFHQVDPEAVGPVVVGGGEEGHKLQPERAGVGDAEHEVIGGRGLDRGAGFQGERVLLPVCPHAADGGAGDGFAGLVAHQANRDGSNVRAAGLGVKRALVLGVGPYRHAPEAHVEYTGLAAGTRLFNVEPETGIEGVARASVFVDGDFSYGIAVFEQVPVQNAAPVGMEGTVAHHLGIEAAFVGVVDLLGHEAVEGGADGGDLLIGMDGEAGGGGRLGARGEGGKRKGQGEGAASKRFLRHPIISRFQVTRQYIASSRALRSPLPSPGALQARNWYIGGIQLRVDPEVSALSVPQEHPHPASFHSPKQQRIYGDGEMATRIRAHDWGTTSLGPLEGWSDALVVLVNALLANQLQMFLFWGDDLVQFYNDQSISILGPEKHPGALGQPAAECWAEIWEKTGPQLRSALQGHACATKTNTRPSIASGKSTTPGSRTATARRGTSMG